MNTVTLVVELKGEALAEAAEMLCHMAEKYGRLSVELEPKEVVVNNVVAPPSTEEIATLPPAAEETAAPVVDLDADNRPWDGRIDSSGASKTQDCRWKIKRGADKALVAEIKAQYATTTLPPATKEVAPPPPPPAAPAAPEAPPVLADLVMTEKANGIPYQSYIDEDWNDKQLVEGGYALPRGEAAAGPVTFEMITEKVTARVQASLILPGELEGILKPFAPQGVTDLPSLCAHPELWAPVHAKLVEAWG